MLALKLSLAPSLSLSRLESKGFPGCIHASAAMKHMLDADIEWADYRHARAHTHTHACTHTKTCTHARTHAHVADLE